MEETFYKHAKAYDIAFAGRDYNEEYKFLEWCFDKHSSIKNKKKSFLELACGPAHHAKIFSKQGWNTFGLDLSLEMIEYAKLNFAADKASGEFIQGDMINFSLDMKVDFIGNFNESITHILTNEDFISHLKAVSNNLNKGGLYIIETAHPMFFFPDDEANIWKAKKKNMEVEMLFGKPDDEYDSVNQIWNLTTQLKISENGKTETLKYKSKHRWYLAQELKLLIQLSKEFDEAWFYGNMEIPPRPLDSSRECDCMIIVLKKK